MGRVENSLAAALPHQTVHAVFPHTDFRCSSTPRHAHSPILRLFSATEDVALAHSTVEGVTIGGLLLGLGIQLPLWRPDRKSGAFSNMAISPDPPPFGCMNKAGFLPSTGVMLSLGLKRYFKPLRLPLRPGAISFPYTQQPVASPPP